MTNALQTGAERLAGRIKSSEVYLAHPSWDTADRISTDPGIVALVEFVEMMANNYPSKTQLAIIYEKGLPQAALKTWETGK